MTQNFIGVDLSQEQLDVFNPSNGHFQIENTRPAIRAFLRRLCPNDMLVFEATSGCDGGIIREASALGQPFHRANPLHVWHFARSLNLPKTDRVDAKMLARLGAERQLEPSPAFRAERAELAELNGRRNQLKGMETQEKNRLGKTHSHAVIRDIKNQLRHFAARIARIEKAIAAFLKAHPELRKQAELLETIPGIGRITSVTLLSLMPELGHCDRRQIASLGGLAPRARESGKWTGQRHTGDGRRHVRRAFYMAALSASRGQGPLAKFAQRLRAKGKPGKLVLVAVARKLLTIANAVVRDQKEFQM